MDKEKRLQKRLRLLDLNISVAGFRTGIVTEQDVLDARDERLADYGRALEAGRLSTNRFRDRRQKLRKTATWLIGQISRATEPLDDDDRDVSGASFQNWELWGKDPADARNHREYASRFLEGVQAREQFGQSQFGGTFLARDLAIIEEIRQIVGEPQVAIDDEIRWLIEATRLYGASAEQQSLFAMCHNTLTTIDQLPESDPNKKLKLQDLQHALIHCKLSAEQILNAVHNSTGQIIFADLSENEAEYARRFYRRVKALRSDQFDTDFRTGLFDQELSEEERVDLGLERRSALELKRTESLKYQSLQYRARRRQICYPFPESADTTREFKGAPAVIQVIRRLIGEPLHPIQKGGNGLRRLLIESCCLYADDSKSHAPHEVRLDSLVRYVTKHSNKYFEDLDKLQLVLCYFLGLWSRPKTTTRRVLGRGDVADRTLFQRVDEVKCEIEGGLHRLAQGKVDQQYFEIHGLDRLGESSTADGNANHRLSRARLSVTVQLDTGGLIEELLASKTIADAVKEADEFKLDRATQTFLARQERVVLGNQKASYKYIGTRVDLPRIGQNRSQTKRHVVERNLIEHRIPSWLQDESRGESWGWDESNITGTSDRPFFSLSDFINKAFGMPTLGQFVWNEAGAPFKAFPTKNKYTMAKHCQGIWSGLLGGGTRPLLFYVPVATCPQCDTVLTDGKCTQAVCAEFEREPEDVNHTKRLIAKDDSYFASRVVDGTTLFFDTSSEEQYNRLLGNSFAADSVKYGVRERLLHDPQLRPLLTVELQRELIQKKNRRREVTHEYSALKIFEALHGLDRSKENWKSIRNEIHRSTGWHENKPSELVRRADDAFASALGRVIASDKFMTSIVSLLAPTDRFVCLQHFSSFPTDSSWSQSADSIDAGLILDAIGQEAVPQRQAKSTVARIAYRALNLLVLKRLDSPWKSFVAFYRQESENAFGKSQCVTFPAAHNDDRSVAEAVRSWWQAEASNSTIDDKIPEELAHSFREFLSGNHPLKDEHFDFVAAEETVSRGLVALDANSTIRQNSVAPTLDSVDIAKLTLEQCHFPDRVGQALWILTWQLSKENLYLEMSDFMEGVQQ